VAFPFYRCNTTHCIIFEDVITAISGYIAVTWKNHIAVNFSFLSDNITIILLSQYVKELFFSSQYQDISIKIQAT